MPPSWLDITELSHAVHIALEHAKFNADMQQYLSCSIVVQDLTSKAVYNQIPSNEVSFFLENRSESFSIVAEGVLEKITTSGIQRFKNTSGIGKELIARVHGIGQAGPSQPIHLIGGFSFTDELDKNKEWSDFDTALFHLPKWLLITQEGQSVLSLVEAFNPNYTVEEWANHFRTKFSKWMERFNPKNLPSSHLDSAKQNEFSLSGKMFSITHSVGPSDRETDDPQRPKTLQSLENIQHWKGMIEEAKKQISEQRLKKVVLARKLSIAHEHQPDAHAIVEELLLAYPDCYVFAFNPKGSSYFVGATPERLARFTPTQVETESLAGSTMRGRNSLEDEVLAGQLLNSKKDRLEHNIVIEAIEEDLVPYSERLELSKAPQVKKLPNVQHLYTPISATFKKGISRTNVLKDLHPTPAVGGFPRSEALRFIKEEENFNRGWYASPIGWINSHGVGEFYVAIRSGLIDDHHAHLYAGCGIVEDSDPEKEWIETELKLQPMIQAISKANQTASEARGAQRYERDSVI